jgi:predicted metal-dependent hydrolase
MLTEKRQNLFRLLKALSYSISMHCSARSEFNEAYEVLEDELDSYTLSKMQEKLNAFELAQKNLGRFRNASGCLPGELRFFFI